MPNKMILIVEDEAEIRDCVRRWFEANGFDVCLAEDGIAGAESACLMQPSAILLDMKMPGKNGLEVLAELRSNELTVDIPVVMLSASLQDEQCALDAGARYFVKKPYDGKQLVATLKVAIEQAEAQTESASTCR